MPLWKTGSAHRTHFPPATRSSSRSSTIVNKICSKNVTWNRETCRWIVVLVDPLKKPISTISSSSAGVLFLSSERTLEWLSERKQYSHLNAISRNKELMVQKYIHEEPERGVSIPPRSFYSYFSSHSICSAGHPLRYF